MLTSRTLLIVGLLSAGCQLSSESVSEGGSAEASLRCSFDSVAPETMFDVVILAGRVIDPECEFDGLRNIGIKGGTIAVVTEGDISGTETIDATALVVAPDSLIRIIMVRAIHGESRRVCAMASRRRWTWN